MSDAWKELLYTATFPKLFFEYRMAWFDIAAKKFGLPSIELFVKVSTKFEYSSKYIV